MLNNNAKRSRGVRLTPETADNLDEDDDELDEMSFRPSHWPRRRRSRKNPTDLEIWKAELRRKIKERKGKKVKLSNRDVLDSLFQKKPMDGTPEEKLLALVELLEDLHPSPNPTFETILDLNMEPFPDI